MPYVYVLVTFHSIPFLFHLSVLFVCFDARCCCCCSFLFLTCSFRMLALCVRVCCTWSIFSSRSHCHISIGSIGLHIFECCASYDSMWKLFKSHLYSMLWVYVSARLMVCALRPMLSHVSQVYDHFFFKFISSLFFFYINMWMLPSLLLMLLLKML